LERHRLMNHIDVIGIHNALQQLRSVPESIEYSCPDGTRIKINVEC
jgi:hypothetical protein